MLPMRQRYLAARDQAGHDFVSKNPGEHFFFEPSGDSKPASKLANANVRVCVFCGHSEAGLKAKAPQGKELQPCPGDIRRKKKAKATTKSP